MGVVRRILLILTLAGLSGCSLPNATSRRDRRAFSSVDSWYSPPSSAIDFTPIPKTHFSLVVNTLQAKAQKRLASQAVTRITAAEAASFAGKELPTNIGVFVLLRGVVLSSSTGSFEVGIRGATVNVHYGCLGHHPLPMSRIALVAVLPIFPKTCFISCSMAE